MGESVVAARDGGDQGDLVAIVQRILTVGVGAVQRERERGRLRAAETEGVPHVGDLRTLGQLELELARTGLLAERGEEAHPDVHGFRTVTFTASRPS